MDSFVEVLSAVFVLLRFYRGRSGAKQPKATATSAGGSPAAASGLGSVATLPAATTTHKWERQSLISISVLLFVLAFSAMAGGVYKLSASVKADTSIAGIIISGLSLSGMLALWYGKAYTAVVLNSAVLEADAACSLDCIHLSWVLLLGSVLRRIDDGLWWVDGVAAIVLGLLILKEATDTLRMARSKDFDGCGCGENAGALIRRLHRRMRTGDGRLKASVAAASNTLANPWLTKSGGRAHPVHRVGGVAVVEDVDEAQAAQLKVEVEANAKAEAAVAQQGLEAGVAPPAAAADVGPDAGPSCAAAS